MTVSVDTPDVGVIAGKLSPKMQAMLRRSRPDHIDRLPRCWGPSNTKAALRNRGLAHGDFAYLTPLGLAVRDYLLSLDEDK